jgi:hypothetical protein
MVSYPTRQALLLLRKLTCNFVSEESRTFHKTLELSRKVRATAEKMNELRNTALQCRAGGVRYCRHRTVML